MWTSDTKLEYGKYLETTVSCYFLGINKHLLAESYSKFMKMTRTLNEITKEGVKIIVLSDAKTNGSSYASAMVIFPDELEEPKND